MSGQLVRQSLSAWAACSPYVQGSFAKLGNFVDKGQEFILTLTEDPILVLYSSDSTPLSVQDNYMRNVTGMSRLCASVISVSIDSCSASQRKQNRHTCTYRHTCIYLGAYIHTYMDTHVSI